MRSLTATDMKVLIGQAWQKVGALWHQAMRPKHFTASGASEYEYGQRKRKYAERKRKTKHHNRPLVYSGELETLSRARRIETKTFQKRSRMRVIMPLARKANWRHPASSIDMREELTRVSDRDLAGMVDEHNRTMTERLRVFGGSLTK